MISYMLLVFKLQTHQLSQLIQSICEPKHPKVIWRTSSRRRQNTRNYVPPLINENNFNVDFFIQNRYRFNTLDDFIDNLKADLFYCLEYVTMY